MTTEARKIWNLNKKDNMTLEPANLKAIAVREEQDFKKNKTTYIFSDNSAIIDCGDNNYRIEPSYEN